MIQEDAMSYFKLGGNGNPNSEHLASVFSVFGQTHCLPFASNLYALSDCSSLTLETDIDLIQPSEIKQEAHFFSWIFPPKFSQLFFISSSEGPQASNTFPVFLVLHPPLFTHTLLPCTFARFYHPPSTSALPSPHLVAPVSLIPRCSLTLLQERGNV